MKLDEEQMYQAGMACEYVTWTDDDLKLAIQGTKMALAYLKGRGTQWWLATTRLTMELNQLETYMENRERGKK